MRKKLGSPGVFLDFSQQAWTASDKFHLLLFAGHTASFSNPISTNFLYDIFSKSKSDYSDAAAFNMCISIPLFVPDNIPVSFAHNCTP